LVVSVDQGTMAAGSYPATIQVLDSNGLATDVSVTLNIVSAPQQLNVAPSSLNFAARSATPGNLIEQLVVSNSGAGSLSFTASSLTTAPGYPASPPAPTPPRETHRSLFKFK
jgi:hypothetical protein